MKEVRFTVPGYCQPKQRTITRRFITPPETKAYEATVALYARQAMKGQRPFEGFVGLEIEIICAVPGSWSRKKRTFALEGKLFPTHCDASNQLKSCEDAMNGVIYSDASANQSHHTAPGVRRA